MRGHNWPSPDAFHYPDTVLKWRDISTGVFKILDKFERGDSKYGKGLVVKLESFSGSYHLRLGSGQADFRSQTRERRQIRSEPRPQRRCQWLSIFRFQALLILHISMLVFTHLIFFVFIDYFTPDWQKEVRDISRQVVAALLEADDRRHSIEAS